MIARRGLIALAAAMPIAARAQAPDNFEMSDPAGVAEVPLRVFLHRPGRWTSADRAIIVMHGLRRDADRYLAEWAPLADAANLLLIAPEFSRAKFPTVASYNWGNVVTLDLSPNPPDAWSFGVIDRVWAAVQARTGASRAGYTLFGHSAGAQFTHRYLLLAPASQAEAIITANAGSYTMPVRDVAFPFGLGGLDLPDARLAAAFARPVTLLLGADDIDPNHPSLPRQPGAIAQGAFRLARGLRFYAEARAAAARLAAPFAWRLETVPGVGHDNAGMARRAAAIAAG